MGPKVGQLSGAVLAFGVGRREGELGVADIERVEKGPMMEEGGIIDIERDLADERDGFLTMFIIEDPDVLGDESAERIDREMSDRRFHSAFMEFFHDAFPPFAAKPLVSQVPTAADQGGHRHHHGQANRADEEAPGKGRMSPLGRGGGRRGFDDGGHGRIEGLKHAAVRPIDNLGR